MTSQDFYEKTGFKCGLEIHIQLNTERKLFCDCPNRRSAEFPTRIKRKIRPSAGELGKTDPAAMHEFLRKKTFSYAINRETACLVETDEEPPHEINKEALGIALSAAKSLRCSVPDEIIVMRKVVADGSSVSGFQRTALAGINGILETESGDVRIANLSLEEDSATPISGNESEFRLDRLGVPLIEIGTEPDIKNAEQAKQIAEKIGMLLFQSRLRGIGAIRQDLNVSIKGGARVEIKGVQELEKIESIIINEIRRQQSLIEIKNELEIRKANQIEVGGAYFQRNGKYRNITELHENEVFGMSETKFPYISKDVKSNIVQKSINEGGSVFAGMLKGFAGLLKKDCGGRTFGKELSSYAGVFGLGIIHSDEIEKFPFLAEGFEKIRKELSAEDSDLVFIVAGKNAEKACKAVMDRAEYCIKGIPKETRAANPDCTTSYLRPLPGAARMYPETDVPSIKTRDFLKKTKPLVSAEEKLGELEKILPAQMAKQMARSEYLGLFEKIMERKSGAQKNVRDAAVPIANLFTNILPNLKREGVRVENISDEKIFDIFIMPQVKEIIPEVMKDIAKNPEKSLLELESMKSTPLSRKEAENIIVEIMEKNRAALEKPSAFSILMGDVMKKLRGKIDGSVAAEILRNEIEKRKKKKTYNSG